jgi:hypothetical protein
MATKKVTPDAAAAPEPMVAVRALTPIRHNGADYAETLEFEVNESAAVELVAAGLVELVLS